LDFGFRIADFEFRIADFEFWMLDLGGNFSELWAGFIQAYALEPRITRINTNKPKLYNILQITRINTNKTNKMHWVVYG